MSETIQETIDRVAAGPAAASNDAGSIQEHRIPDLLALKKDAANDAALANPARGIRFTKLNPPSALG